jgi:hypothetical protein
MLSIGLWRWYINITITILDIIHRPVFYLKLNSTLLGLSVPHRKHITSQLRARQVNTVYRFVTINVTTINLDTIHRPVFYLKHDISDTGFCLRLQVVPTQLGKIDRASPCIDCQSFQSLSLPRDLITGKATLHHWQRENTSKTSRNIRQSNEPTPLLK